MALPRQAAGVTRRLLMCPPWRFDVGWHLQNAHMKMNREVQHGLAQRQWVNLYNVITHKAGAQVTLIPPATGMMDMVFSANGALIKGDRAMVSRFKAQGRVGETPPYEAFLRDSLGFHVRVAQHHFEGQGDALFSHGGRFLWIGSGFRTDETSHQEVRDFFGMDQTVAFSLRLQLEEFYHLDTCFCPLDLGQVLYYKKAFDADGVAAIHKVFGKENCISVGQRDARAFACNAISLGRNVILNSASDELKEKLQHHGYTVHETSMSEYLLSGGSTKCSILHLDLPGQSESSVTFEPPVEDEGPIAQAA